MWAYGLKFSGVFTPKRPLLKTLVWSCALGAFTVPVMPWSRMARWRDSCRLAGWWVRLGFPTDTELIAVRDWFGYGYLVRLRNSVGAPLRPVWLGGMVGVVWLHCSYGWSANKLGRLLGGFLWGLENLLVSPTLKGVVMWVGGGQLCFLLFPSWLSVPSIIAGNLLGMANGPTWRPKPTGWHWLTCPTLKRWTFASLMVVTWLLHFSLTSEKTFPVTAIAAAFPFLA